MELGNLIFGHSRGVYPIDRRWTDSFLDFLEKCDIDSYGNYEGNNDEFKTSRGGFENDIFSVNPYWWGCEDSEETEKPNFIYKPTNFEIQWYKYPFRDSYMNQDTTFNQFKKILNECIKSIKA